MGLFGTRREPPDDDLRGRIQTLETDVKLLRLEWTGVADKLLHRLQRQAKRDRDAIVAEPTVDAGKGNGAPAGPGDPRAARALRKAELYERAAARRIGGLRS